MTVAVTLAFAALVIVLCAEPFAESLVQTGEEFGVSTFLLVQWLAPLASEAPELLVAALFAWRLNTNDGLGTLVSSKVNQWTLLVGTLPLVFVIAGGATSGLPLDGRQREELFLTAAQSAFAVAVLLSRSLSVREAFALLGLFMGQFVLGGVLPPDVRDLERIVVGDHLPRAHGDHGDPSATCGPAPAAGRVPNTGARARARRRAESDMTEPTSATPAGGMTDAIDWRVVLRGACYGLAVIVPVTVLRVILDREVARLRRQRLDLPALRAHPHRVRSRRLGRGSQPARRAPHPRRARRSGCVRALGPDPRSSSGRCERTDGALFSGDDAALSPGQVFGQIVIAAAIGMLGAVVAARVDANRRRAV